MSFLSIILFDVASTLEHILPRNQTKLALVPENRFREMIKKHSLRCANCEEDVSAPIAILIDNGRHTPICSMGCYDKLLSKIGE